MYEFIFNHYVKIGRELTPRELAVFIKRSRYRFRKNAHRLIYRRVRDLYQHRWHEISGVAKTVEAPAPAPKPKKKAKTPEPTLAPEPAPKADPLEALRKARAHKEEEHE